MVLQIVAGVVIGGLVLAALPVILTLGFYAVIILVGLIAAGAALYWLYDNPTAILLVGLMSLGVVLYRRHEQKQFEKSTAGAIKRLEDQIEYRSGNGYDVTEHRLELYRLRDQLAAEQRTHLEQERDALLSSPEYLRKLNPKVKKVSKRALAKEHERRKALGYED